jgi:hypothetical protein
VSDLGEIGTVAFSKYPGISDQAFLAVVLRKIDQLLSPVAAHVLCHPVSQIDRFRFFDTCIHQIVSADKKEVSQVLWRR